MDPFSFPGSQRRESYFHGRVREALQNHHPQHHPCSFHPQQFLHQSQQQHFSAYPHQQDPQTLAPRIAGPGGPAAPIHVQQAVNPVALAALLANPLAQAAVVAMAQLTTQLAGTVSPGGVQVNFAVASGPAPRAPIYPPPAGQSPHKVGNIRGNVFRERSRGNFSHNHSRCGLSGPSFHKKQHCTGGDQFRHLPNIGVTSSSYKKPSVDGNKVSAYESKTLVHVPKETACMVPPQASQSTLAMEKVGPSQRPSWTVRRCELCRVKCNSFEILKQHENGRRHKRNLKKIEELKHAVKPEIEVQNTRTQTVQLKPESSQQPKHNHDGTEENPTENTSAKAVDDENGTEREQYKNMVGQPAATAEESSQMQERIRRMNQFDDSGCQTDCIMQVAGGGKRLKTLEAPRQPVGAHENQIAIPLVCDLCNVKCQAQEIFDSHLSGKKHVAKVKRFEGNQAMCGSFGLQVLYPPSQSASVTPGLDACCLQIPQNQSPEAEISNPDCLYIIASESQKQQPL